MEYEVFPVTTVMLDDVFSAELGVSDEQPNESPQCRVR